MDRVTYNAVIIVEAEFPLISFGEIQRQMSEYRNKEGKSLELFTPELSPNAPIVVKLKW